MKIVDLAKAIAPDCKHEIVGIRPGEKLHEILISEDDTRNTIQFNECYIVQPNPEAREEFVAQNNGSGKLCPDGFSYTSNNNSDWITVDDLKRLVENIVDDYSIEKSRWSMEDVPQ